MSLPRVTGSTKRAASVLADALGRCRCAPRQLQGGAMAVREARLRPEWAHLYPGLEANAWAVAAELVPLVLRHRLQNQPTWEFTRRILVDEHFEFRGGRDRGGSWRGRVTP